MNIDMTFEEWEKKYKPSEETDVIHQVPNNVIWTKMSCDLAQYIVNGFWRVDAMGYYITEVPFDEGDHISILVKTYEELLAEDEFVEKWKEERKKITLARWKSFQKKNQRNKTVDEEGMRREIADAINSSVESKDEQAECARLEKMYGDVWNREQLEEAFKVTADFSPFCRVQRKSDGVEGTLMYQYNPLLYFDFQET